MFLLYKRISDTSCLHLAREEKNVKASFDSHTHCARCRERARTFVLRTLILLIARFVTLSPLSNVNNWPLHHIKLRKKTGGKET